jgi:hypothetical protein
MAGLGTACWQRPDDGAGQHRKSLTARRGRRGADVPVKDTLAYRRRRGAGHGRRKRTVALRWRDAGASEIEHGEG